ncbi:MAG: PHP domain-containing protein [Clostridiales bacterium]|nr:PHP domain-containing protein [Clostridiales bacterium]
MMRADLHIHTLYSDGLLTPEEVISIAKQNGVKMLSVTDHDCMGASKIIKNLAIDAGICAVDGIEISAYEGVKVHVLGYNLNTDCERFKQYYSRCIFGAEERVKDSLKKLARRGIHLTLQDVERERKIKTSPLHSSYVARAASRKGYSSSPYKFYVDYLNMGKCAYSDLCRPTPEEAVKIITDCGGVASLAHPGRISLSNENKNELIIRLINCGLGGIEACYSGHTIGETAYFKELAERFSLFVTGGSDTHFKEGNRSIGTPEFYPDEKLLSALKIN